MSTTNIGFEETLWKVADKLRSSMDSREYKHVVLGIIFMKYISDKLGSKYNKFFKNRIYDQITLDMIQAI